MKTIAILGAGTMGHGIAHVSALAGYEVGLFDISGEAIDSGLARIKANMEGGLARGKLGEGDMNAALARISGGTDLAAICEDVDLVIEAVPERIELKQELLSEVQHMTSGILATNTSSLSIAKIAEAVDDPSRVLGLHFFNPVHIMKLLEIVVQPRTSAEVLASCKSYGESIGKQCITVRDVPGFATSRLGVCLGMEAIRMVEQGVASAADIDAAMVLGYRHPLGPLKLGDLIGLDVRMQVGEYLAKELDNPAFEPPELLRRMVAEGRLGQKTGRGFYDW
ncbi:MAG TPA: 3-hydroxyacyl-CoA dehydrogenase family protein [Myxococcota bacterium]|nr:3-hydroxyacyl-CoA dehydrogenase family protein [Myxococcota bacterium]